MIGICASLAACLCYVIFEHLCYIVRQINTLSLCETVLRPSVSPSVCLSHRSTAAAEAGRFSAERPIRAGHIDRQAPALISKCGQCHVDSQGTRMNTDLLLAVLWSLQNSEPQLSLLYCIVSHSTDTKCKTQQGSYKPRTPPPVLPPEKLL